MAVNRIWFFNAPSGLVNELQRSQIAIGYPFSISFVLIEFLSYLRRYLNDSDTLDTLTVPTFIRSLAPASTFLTYLRSYLGDS